MDRMGMKQSEDMQRVSDDARVGFFHLMMRICTCIWKIYGQSHMAYRFEEEKRNE